MLGGFIEGHGWFHTPLPEEFATTLDPDGKEREADINIYEFIAVIATASLAVRFLPPPQ